ncbi:MAG: PAS domain-containing protein [Alphaproteobacteria bacterium]|nr:PAS domain-containing protein [Alphaproteobacteria bacterium]
MPPRISVRPADIKPMLPWTVLAERDGPGHLVPTVIGSAVDDILRVSLTGLNLFDHWSEELGAQMDEFYSSITDTPCGGFMVRSLETSGGLLKDYISSLFPLVGASGKVDRVFGLISVSKEEPLLASFGRPEDIETSVTDMSFIDIGFGVP